MFIEICKKCGKKYKVEECNVGASGGKESVGISCPYCGNSLGYKINNRIN